MSLTAPIVETPTSEPRQAPPTERLAIAGILCASAGAVAFLLWLLYFHDPSTALSQQWVFLPQLNALLNGLSAVTLCVGLYFIKRKNWRAHRASMLTAFGFSSLFLVGFRSCIAALLATETLSLI